MHRTLVKILWIALACASLGVAGGSLAQTPVKNKSKATDAQPASAAVVSYVRKSGIQTCLMRVDQVTQFLTGNNQAGVFAFMPLQGNPDQQLFSTSMEVRAPGVLAYASATFAPVTNGGCGTVYETVTYHPESCDVVARGFYGSLKVSGAIKQDIRVLDGDGQTMRIFLMPANSGCVAIKKELVN